MTDTTRESEIRKALKRNIAIAMRGDDKYRRWPLSNMVEVDALLSELDAARTALAAAEAREGELREALEGVAIYGSDTLSGPVPPQRHDLIWARDGIREMVRRTRAALKKGEGQ